MRKLRFQLRSPSWYASGRAWTSTRSVWLWRPELCVASFWTGGFSLIQYHFTYIRVSLYCLFSEEKLYRLFSFINKKICEQGVSKDELSGVSLHLRQPDAPGMLLSLWAKGYFVRLRCWQDSVGLWLGWEGSWLFLNNPRLQPIPPLGQANLCIPNLAFK